MVSCVIQNDVQHVITGPRLTARPRQQHHPITGVPTFFVHPCLIGDAMANFDCTKEDYLMVWLGQVGGCVGLWIPREMALQAA